MGSAALQASAQPLAKEVRRKGFKESQVCVLPLPTCPATQVLPEQCRVTILLGTMICLGGPEASSHPHPTHTTSWAA